MNTIQSKFDEYTQLNPSENTSGHQKSEIRRAFYAGAVSILAIIEETAEQGISDQAFAAIVDGIYDESASFAKKRDHLTRL